MTVKLRPLSESCFPDEFGIGVEPALPKPLADYDYVVVAFTKFVLGEAAAANRLNAEHGKQTRGHHGASDPLRHFAGGEIKIDVIKARDLETLQLLRVIEIFRGRDRDLIQALRGKFLPQENELLRILVWQRANQQRVDQAEHGGVRADRERHGNDGNEGEARRVDQAAKGQTEILNHKFRWTGSCDAPCALRVAPGRFDRGYFVVRRPTMIVTHT